MFEPTPILCDNMAVIFIAKNSTMHDRTKHIDIKFHFIRNLIAEGLICIKFCGREEQITDICTKALMVRKYLFLREILGVHNFSLKEDVESN